MQSEESGDRGAALVVSVAPPSCRAESMLPGRPFALKESYCPRWVGSNFTEPFVRSSANASVGAHAGSRLDRRLSTSDYRPAVPLKRWSIRGYGYAPLVILRPPPAVLAAHIRRQLRWWSGQGRNCPHPPGTDLGQSARTAGRRNRGLHSGRGI